MKKELKENNQSLVTKINRYKSEILLLKIHIQNRNKNESKKLVELRKQITELKNYCEALQQSNQKLQAMYIQLVSLINVQRPFSLVNSDSRFSYQSCLQKLIEKQSSLAEQKGKEFSQTNRTSKECTADKLLDLQKKTVNSYNYQDRIGVENSKQLNKKNILCEEKNTPVHKINNSVPLNIKDITKSESAQSHCVLKPTNKFDQGKIFCHAQRKISDSKSCIKTNADMNEITTSTSEGNKKQVINKNSYMSHGNYWNEKQLFNNSRSFTQAGGKTENLKEIFKIKSKR